MKEWTITRFGGGLQVVDGTDKLGHTLDGPSGLNAGRNTITDCEGCPHGTSKHDDRKAWSGKRVAA